jgi:hypothetical protein
MSLWRKRISIKSDDLSIKSEKAMREVQRLGQEIEQEPVAWQWLTTAHFRKKLPKDAEKGAWNPLYTTPQQRKPLTDDEIAELWLPIYASTPTSGIHEDGLMPWRLARAIEAAHGIKENT